MVFDVVRGHGVDHGLDLIFDYFVKSAQEFGEDGQRAFNLRKPHTLPWRVHAGRFLRLLQLLRLFHLFRLFRMIHRNHTMIWMTLSELIPEALENAASPMIASAVTMSVAGMLLFELILRAL